MSGLIVMQEKSECLTRESPLVRSHDALRRIRKALLSDLSSLVKTSKSFKEIANGTPMEDEVEYMLDEMLLKAFKIVTRGVRFLDVWNEEVGLDRTIAELEQSNLNSHIPYDVPPTPASDTFTISEAGDTVRSESRLLNRSRMESRMETRMESRMESRMDTSRASMRSEAFDVHHPRPVSCSTKRVSHRMSYSGAAGRNPNLASERLKRAEDAFLGVLGLFIGLHLQSRSSSELIATTQRAVQSCSSLLTVVEAVCDHGLQGCEFLEGVEDKMRERLFELVHATDDASRPAHAAGVEVVFMPDEGKRLVDAATDCVKAAKACLSKARMVLEQAGDFELDEVRQDAVNPESSDATTPQAQHDGTWGAKHDRPSDMSLRLPPPPLQIPNEDHSPSTPGLTDNTTPSSFQSRVESNSPGHGPDSSLLPSSTTFSTTTEKPAIPSSGGNSPHRISNPKSDACDSFGRGVTSNGSSFTTYHTRDSEMSAVSQTSTRATSPDIGNQHQAPSLKGSVSHSTLAEENEETEANILEKTYAHELIFKDGQIMGGSLRALVELLTAHHSTPDAMFSSAFYLTFRLFASPLEFAHALADRFDYVGDTPNAAGPVRLRVYNVFKGWLESHWRHDRDNVALDFIMAFARTTLMTHLPSAAKRLVELVEKVSMVHGPIVPRLVSSMGKTSTATAQYVHPDTPLPPPILSKKESALLTQWKNSGTTLSILDFDPMELARQFTIKESRIFCAILPEELLGLEWTKKTGSLSVNVRAMSTLATDLSNLVSDSILQLEEPKKRASVIKHWVKIANKCLELNNYDTLMAIICSLNSSMIARLKRTWETMSQKTKITLEHLRSIVDVSRNSAVLRQRLQNHVPPCQPFVGTYLTDLTFADLGNSPQRSLQTDDGEMAVINFDRHMKTAKIISELQRFQIPYRLTEVPELQAWMQDELVRVRSYGEMCVQSYYRRSLALEPREMQPRPSLPTETGPSVLEAAKDKFEKKDKFDFLSWAHPSKAKSIATNG